MAEGAAVETDELDAWLVAAATAGDAPAPTILIARLITFLAADLPPAHARLLEQAVPELARSFKDTPPSSSPADQKGAGASPPRDHAGPTRRN
ncbi:MAG: hypothetical protein DI570_09755 [Phenylobacterium zucineum]|nr:MAG: hypothetical protein DI570_09755 [Phenylobacterium zucineum]